MKPWGPHDDVVGHLAEAERVVDRRADIVGDVDRALFQRREDFGPRQHGRFRADLVEHFGDHAARQPHLAAAEIVDRADRHLGVDDVRAVMHGADEMHALRGKQFAGDLETAEAVVEHVELVRIAQAQRDSWSGTRPPARCPARRS
jgi:hypothetical protein